VALAACVRLLATGHGQHTAATLLQYTLSQSALMAATSLAAAVSAAQLCTCLHSAVHQHVSSLVSWTSPAYLLTGSPIDGCAPNLRRCGRLCSCRRSC
jgi:antirestriction protein ArdC